VLVQPDGKILVAGGGAVGQDFVVSRLNPDGSRDTGFDGDGTATADFGGQDDAAAAALQPGGEVVVVGTTLTPIGDRTAVARFRPDGSLDATFDPGGPDGPGKKVLVPADPTVRPFLQPSAVLVQPDGRIVIAVRLDNGTDEDFAVTRLKPDGSVDPTSFDPADFGGSDGPEAAALQPDGKIVLAGVTSPQPPGASQMAVARYNRDGSLDETFGHTGMTAFGTRESVAHAVQVQPDGKILVTGEGTAEDTDMVVTRLKPNGEADTGFGSGGTSAIPFSGTEAAAAAVLQPDGKIVVAGIAQVSAEDFDFAVARLQPGGAPDPTFSSDGKTTVSFRGVDIAQAAALQPDGRIMLAGLTRLERKGTDDDIALARLQADPPPPPGGGPGGEPGGAPGGSASVPRCAGRRATIVGTARRDVLRGTRRADVVVALGGNDVVRAARANDTVCGGAGNDRLTGGPGRDRLVGGTGSDRLIGGRGRDRCLGGGGRDRARCETSLSARPPKGPRHRAPGSLR
jgi:uncharacterized delta-60 repeat protein